ncbi:MAG: hypothetical protein QXX12_01435 [Nanopusillaceae archaeon]
MLRRRGRLSNEISYNIDDTTTSLVRKVGPETKLKGREGSIPHS